MPSWQFKIVKIIFILRRITNRSNGKFDIGKERQETETLAKKFKSRLDIVQTPVKAYQAPADWIEIAHQSHRCTILYLHGGSYNSGSINSHGSLVANISNAALARSLIIEYRKAPEYLFPAAVEDALAAYRWLLSRDIPPQKIVLTGDSCGGGLALALLLKLKETGDPMPAAAVCLSPWTDLTCQGETWNANQKKDLVLDPYHLKASANLYLGDTDPYNPLASPLYGNLEGLPPLLIQVGSDEILLSDSTRFAEQAKAVGVDVTLEVWDQMPHEWHFAADYFPEARQAIEHIGNFVKSHT
ncbi:MAG: alpha/beta hydrolase [Anaerolineales bacterium]|nr:alpha/beta hydrolase [Anaerolineales bacterium]